MRKYETDRFKAMNIKGSGYLTTDRWSLDDVKREIDEHNERMVDRGFKPEQYLITHEERYRWNDDDGMFVEMRVLEQAIEIYPKEV